MRDLVFTHLVKKRGLIDKSLLNPILFTSKLSYCIWLCTLAKQCKLNFSNENSIKLFWSKSPTTCRPGHIYCVSYSVLVWGYKQTNGRFLYRFLAVYALCILQCDSTFYSKTVARCPNQTGQKVVFGYFYFTWLCKTVWLVYSRFTLIQLYNTHAFSSAYSSKSQYYVKRIIQYLLLNMNWTTWKEYY